MGYSIASWTLFLHLLVLLLSHDSEGRPMSIDHLVHHDPNLPSELASTVFFEINDMKAGKTMALYLENKPSSSARLLPREEADSIPFSSKHLPYLLNLFSFPQNSPQALTVKHTLLSCETAPIKVETKFCATSWDSMLGFVRSVFAISEAINPTLLTTTLLSVLGQNAVYQNYTVLESPQEVLTSKVIGCHTLPYPYIMFLCHTLEGGDKVYGIPFVADNGDRLDGFAVCHRDTSEWDPHHVSFRALGTKPGSPVCHLFPPYDNYIWVHAPTTTTSPE